MPVPHHFTVDVEEYFHPTPIERWIPRERWPTLKRRAAPVIHTLLERLEAHGTKGTFFILGWLAEREPEMVRAIAGAGHEIASHGWNHHTVMQLSPAEFREDVRRSRSLLQELAGVPVVGYRAPSFSIIPGYEWALDTLVEEGYLYDSSLFPVRTHPSYGYPCDRDPHLIERPPGTLAELPPVTLRVGGANLPAAGGAYFRFLPYAVVAGALRQAADRLASGTFYIHPWELDRGLPDPGLPWSVRLRTRGRSGDLWHRLDRLLDEFSFQRMDATARGLLSNQGNGQSVSPGKPPAQRSESLVMISTAPRLSIVVPVLNEQENVGPLIRGVREALEGEPSWELLLVDDGSTDATADLIREAERSDPRVRLVRLARRYGQSTAMQAGFDQARARVIVTMDGDLQNDPRDIPNLVAELGRGWDLVAGYREQRQDRLIRRKIPSWIANRIIAWVTGVRIRDNGCSLKAYRRELLDRMHLYSDMHRFIPALAAGMAGARISEIPVRHHPRTRGKSKYGLSRVGKVLVDLLTVKMIRSFRMSPARMFGTAALVAGLIGLGFVGLAWRAFGAEDPYIAGSVVYSGVSLFWLSFAVFLFLLGLIGQVVVTTTQRASRDPGPLLHEVHP